MVDDAEEEDHELPARLPRSRGSRSSSLIEIEDEGDDEDSDGYDGDDDVNMDSEYEPEQGFRMRERSRKGKESATYSRRTQRKESLKVSSMILRFSRSLETYDYIEADLSFFFYSVLLDLTLHTRTTRRGTRLA